MNTSVKGRNKELLCQKNLVAKGHVILFRSQRIRFGRIDFANLFDLVTLSPEGMLYFISVKHSTSSGGAIHRDAIEGFANALERKINEYSRFEVWVWHKRKGWAIWRNPAMLKRQWYKLDEW